MQRVEPGVTAFGMGPKGRILWPACMAAEARLFGRENVCGIISGFHFEPHQSGIPIVPIHHIAVQDAQGTSAAQAVRRVERLLVVGSIYGAVLRDEVHPVGKQLAVRTRSGSPAA